jgi:hypothetical protein
MVKWLGRIKLYTGPLLRGAAQREIHVFDSFPSRGPSRNAVSFFASEWLII